MKQIIAWASTFGLLVGGTADASRITVLEGRKPQPDCHTPYSAYSGRFSTRDPTPGASYGPRTRSKVLAALDFIYDIYLRIAARDAERPAGSPGRGFTPESVEAMRRADRNMALEDAAYVFAEDEATGLLKGIMRVVYGGFARFARLRPAEALADFQLPMERNIPFLVGKLSPHKIEIGRLGTVEGRYRLATAFEMTTAAVEFLFREAETYNRPLLDAYTFYVEGDRSTAALYRSLGFTDLYGPEEMNAPGLYVLSMQARDLYRLMLGPLEQARQLYTPSNRSGDPEAALNVINAAIANLPPRMRDIWIPGLKAKAECELGLRRWAEAAVTTARLSELDPTDFATFKMSLEAQASALYDPSQRSGAGQEALAVLDAAITDAQSRRHADCARTQKIRTLLALGRFADANHEIDNLWNYSRDDAPAHMGSIEAVYQHSVDSGRPWVGTIQEFQRLESLTELPSTVAFNPYYFVFKAERLAEQGLHEGAREAAATATALAPQNDEIRRAAARLRR